jgi:hypothetical protein
MKIIWRVSLAFLLLLFSTPIFVSAQNEKKATFGILLDNTGTMRSQFGNVQILGYAVAQNASQRGFVSLFNFQTSGDSKQSFAVVGSGTEWSQDKNVFEKHIAGLAVVGGQTALFDSIRSMGKAIDTKATSEKLPERILVLITDGEDRDSEITEKQLIKELKESGVKVYAIALIEDLDSSRGIGSDSAQNKSKNFLKKVTKETGGNVVFPKLKKDTKVQDILTELFTEPSKK